MKPNSEILVYTHYFLPANNAGGPPKSLANLIDATKDKLKFKVMCCDPRVQQTCGKVFRN